MTATLMPLITLSIDELLAVAARVGVHGFPTVLAVRSRHATVDGRHAAMDRATEHLAARGVVVDGIVNDDVAEMLYALHRPARELSMRFVTPDGMARISVARRGSTAVLARRIGDDVMLRGVVHQDGEGGLRDAVEALKSELPHADPARMDPVGAPLDAMAEALSGTHDGPALADRIRTLGAETRTAMTVGTALASRQAFAEITYHVLVDDEDRVSRGPAAVGVFYTRRGRIVAAPSASPSGELWSTLKPGSDHALTQAIGQLVDISAKRWGDS